jgi:rare lipoprotein A (peptidoglycan hydrolase)
MWSARLATVITGLFLMSLPAEALKPDSYSGLTIAPLAAAGCLAPKVKFTPAPVHNFRQAKLMAPPTVKLPDRSRLNLARPRMAASRETVANPAARIRLPIAQRMPMSIRHAYPAITIPPYTAAPTSARAVSLRHHPEVSGEPAAVFDPLRFVDYCAAIGPCDPLAFALSRALQIPEADDRKIALRLDSMIARNRTPALSNSGFAREIASADLCRRYMTSKLDYFACLGLPSESLKKEIGSPMFDRVGLIPRGGGRHMIGKPYRIAGQWYHPREIPDYDEIGLASWYGHRFHRRMTANGEWFDMEYLTAAHPTLPLPSYARVVNLENGKEMVVRVNDRGPFVGRRLIDLSKKTAEALDFRPRGIARVRVQYIGPAPLDDDGKHLTAMNRELRRGTPLNEMIAYASGLRQRQAMVLNAASGASTPAQSF